MPSTTKSSILRLWLSSYTRDTADDGVRDDNCAADDGCTVVIDDNDDGDDNEMRVDDDICVDVFISAS